MRLATSCVCVCLLAAAAGAQEPEPPRADPVDLLGQALRAPLRDAAPRDAQLRAAVGRLGSLDELRRALLLNAWRDRDPDENLAAVDARHRAAVVERFERGVQAALRQEDLDARLGALKVVGALDLRVPGTGEAPLARDFSGDLAEATRTGPVAHRELAARTLGRVNPEPVAAAAALGVLLRDPDPRLRAAAAEALGALTATALRLGPPGARDDGARAEVIAAASAAVPVAAGGLGDAGADVRRRCAEVLAGAAEALAAVVAEPPAADEVENWAAYQGDVEQEREGLRPLIAALREQSAALARAAADADPQVRVIARHALESVAGARVRLLARASSALAPPQEQGDAAVAGRSAAFLLEDPLLSGLRQALPALADGVGDAEVEARRAAIDALEAMGRQAAPAAPALVAALADRDRFVRWSAARALGKVRPTNAEATVTSLARLLGDGDCDVRLAAAGALAAFGPGARAALPALVAAAQAREPELRLAAIRALDRIGSDDAASVAVLSAALNDVDPRVRRLAAEALERSGPSHGETVKALMRPSPREEAVPTKKVGSVQPR